MASKHLLAIAAVAAAFSGLARAEADASQYVLQFEGSRTRAEVMAEARQVAATRSIEPAGSRVITVQSSADAQKVRADAAQAVRLGQVSRGEASM